MYISKIYTVNIKHKPYTIKPRMIALNFHHFMSVILLILICFMCNVKSETHLNLVSHRIALGKVVS